MKLLPLALLLTAALAGCRVTTTERLGVRPEPAVIRHASATRAWSLDQEDALLGYVILFEIPEEPDRLVYMVRNRWHQDLGMIDSLGRAWRYRLHEDEAEWIATGTILDGARAILDGAEESRLEEIELPLTTPATHRP